MEKRERNRVQRDGKHREGKEMMMEKREKNGKQRDGQRKGVRETMMKKREKNRKQGDGQRKEGKETTLKRREKDRGQRGGQRGEEKGTTLERREKNREQKSAQRKENREVREKEAGSTQGNRRNVKYDGPKTEGAQQSGEECCPYAKRCGGCDLQGMDYKKQLKKKQEYVNKCVGGLCKVRPIIGMEHPYHYRNKVHAVFDIVREERGGRRGGANREAAPGTIISGVYAAGTHDVVNIDACMIEDETASAIIRDIRGLLRSFKIKTYDEDTGYGLLRHVLIRRGFHSGEVMVVLVLGSPILPSKNNFIKAIRKLHPEISTIILNVNDKNTSMVLGEKEKIIYGKGYIEDTLCGCKFRISPKSFYQVNPVQTEILYNKAISYAGLTGKERVIDAYCGIGTIGLVAAANAREVIGVELNRDAVKDAIINARQNQIKNVRFYQADAGEFMVDMAAGRSSDEGRESGRVDVVFMDPPRAGSDEAFLTSLVKLAPKRVVYVSCNPETLARDLKFLERKGYRAVECQAVDLFPWTMHVETCVLLGRK